MLHSDLIWVYHRPRALADTDSGALDAAGKNAAGAAIRALGHPRPYGRLSGCCIQISSGCIPAPGRWRTLTAARLTPPVRTRRAPPSVRSAIPGRTDACPDAAFRSHLGVSPPPGAGGH